MTSLAVKIELPNISSVIVTDESITVELDDGRTLSVPTAWYPRLFHASKEERDNWRLIGKGRGIHWESLDEDISAKGLIAGRSSGENQASLKRWLESRKIA